MACLEVFEVHEAREDFTGAGWLLTAIQEQVKEHNLPGWQALRFLVDDVLGTLGLVEMTVH